MAVLLLFPALNPSSTLITFEYLYARRVLCNDSCICSVSVSLSSSFSLAVQAFVMFHQSCTATSEMFASRRTDLDLAATWSFLSSLLSGIVSRYDGRERLLANQEEHVEEQLELANKHMSASMSYKTRKARSSASNLT
jgi:hypothetical protein